MSTSTFVHDSDFTTTGIVLRTGTNAYTASGTLSVSSGGTGVVTLAANGVLYGNGTGNIQATAAGANGTILYSNNGTPASDRHFLLPL